jgi:hypothetical protein
MRSEGLGGPQVRGPQVPELQEQCHRLQLLVSDLLLKNHELRFEVERLRNEQGPNPIDVS